MAEDKKLKIQLSGEIVESFDKPNERQITVLCRPNHLMLTFDTDKPFKLGDKLKIKGTIEIEHIDQLSNILEQN